MKLSQDDSFYSLQAENVSSKVSFTAAYRNAAKISTSEGCQSRLYMWLESILDADDETWDRLHLDRRSSRNVAMTSLIAAVAADVGEKRMGRY